MSTTSYAVLAKARAKYGRFMTDICSMNSIPCAALIPE